MADLRQAVALNPRNLRAVYQLAEETERQGAGDSEAEFQQLVQKILAVQPNNLAALLELSRIAAKQGGPQWVVGHTLLLDLNGLEPFPRA